MQQLIEFTTPALKHGMGVLSAYVSIAEEHVRGGGAPEEEIVAARLAPDMMPFSGQIQRASDTAKNGTARLLGVKAPSFADVENTFTELHERIDKTVRFLGEVRSTTSQGHGDVIEFKFGPVDKQFTAQQYVQNFLLPNFYFHVATAHGILRHLGVKVGKLNYLHID